MRPTRAGGNGPRQGRRVVLTGKTVTYRRPILTEGQVECPVCRRSQKPLANGLLRKHRDLFGHPCANKASGLLDRTQQIAEALAEAERAEKERQEQERARETAPATPRQRTRSGYQRTTVTGYCHTCDRPVTGERRYCGPCMAERLSNRKRRGAA